MNLSTTLLPAAECAGTTFRPVVAALDAAALARLEARPEGRLEDFRRVTVVNGFVAEQTVRGSAMLLDLVERDELKNPHAPGELCNQLQARLGDCAGEDELGRRLRRLRTRQQLRIIWRDLTRRTALAETCHDLLALADACTDLVCEWLHRRQHEQSGASVGRRSGESQWMVVLGMGKLGAVELNLPSDIDPIFGYPENDGTEGAKRSLNNRGLLTCLEQKPIKALDMVAVDGLVFRVDIRLRSYGFNGPLVHSFAALEQRYQDQRHDRERYMMIEAWVAGDGRQVSKQLFGVLRLLVYRRHLDFFAIEVLRTAKQLIQQEARRKGISENIELGEDGTREVEFTAQAFQLIHGGRDLSLQQRPLLKALAVLERQGCLPLAVVEELRGDYESLRYAEHTIQALVGRQTQTLLSDEHDRIRVALIMGFVSWAAFRKRLSHWQTRIDWYLCRAIADPGEDESDEATCGSVGAEWIPLWEEALDEESASW